jgi:hypothetical protein
MAVLRFGNVSSGFGRIGSGHGYGYTKDYQSLRDAKLLPLVKVLPQVGETGRAIELTKWLFTLNHGTCHCLTPKETRKPRRRNIFNFITLLRF